MALFSQTNTFPSTGNSGIGTATPTAKLNIIGSDGLNSSTCTYTNLPLLKIDYHLGDLTNCPLPIGGGSGISGISSDIMSVRRYPYGSTSYVSTFEINSASQVGIGMYPNSPAFKFFVNGNSVFNNNMQIKQKLRINNGSLTSNDFLTTFPYSFSVDYGNSRFLNKVEIGNKKPVTTAYNNFALAVYGNIVSTKSIVQTSDWADFVFAPQYQLMSLEQLENCINQNKHLPDMPSETEVVANGLDIGEMLKMQQQKIEELTLYIIELNKKIEAIEKKPNH